MPIIGTEPTPIENAIVASNGEDKAPTLLNQTMVCPYKAPAREAQTRTEAPEALDAKS